jgi:Effector-associated domain 7/NACHT domain
MDWLSNVSPVWREYFLGAAGDATGGLVAQFVSGLLTTARRQVRERFHLPEQTHALQNAIAGAFDTALGVWTINDDASTPYCNLFRDWLLNPAVLNEFCTLLAPDDKSALNLDLLREKFEDTGLSADHLGTASFDVLVQDMVGAFYLAAIKEPALQASLKISLLRQMAERMGALERLEQLAQPQVVAGEQTVDLLTQIRQFTQQAAAGQGDPNELLQNISEMLTTTAQHGSSEELRSAYQQSELALTTVGLPTSTESRELRVRLREILIDRFNESELKTFCFDLGIPYEDLPGSGKADHARELVAYCERHACTHSLIQTGAQLRPDIDWPGLNGEIREQPNGIPRQELPVLARVLTTLDDIHARLTTGVDGPSPEKRAAVEAHYRQTIIDQFEKLTFKGLSPSGTPIVLPLEQVYVELKAVADVPEAADTYSAEERRLLLEAEGRGERVREELALHLDVLRAERWNRQARQDMARLQRRSIQEILDNPAQRGVVILGDPGSGKTTLLQYQALRTARARGDGSAAPAPLPIFVPLAAYDDFLRRTPQGCSLENFLAIYYDRWHSLPGLAPLFQHALAEGRALVLLDGLDEVLVTTTRQFVAEQAGALIRQWASRGNRFAVTSRIVGYREARLPGNLTHVTVLDFGRTEIEIFAHQWCRSYEAWVAGAETPTARQRAVAEERALLEDVRSNPSVERLAASPLLLTMLALLRRHVDTLPDRRIELYERYIRTLIDNWHTVRSPGARQQAPERFDPHTAIAYLIELAFWLQQHKPSGTARRQELEQVLETICLRFEGHDPDAASPKARVQAQQTAARFLQDMRHFAGLLAERGRDAFGFLHLTFQEYFCGRALARMEPDARWAAIQPNLHRPRWREPILLCAGQLGVVEQRRDLVSDLALRVLNAGSAYEPILHRDLFLTTALAADNVGLFPTPLNTIAAQLASLQTSPIPTVRSTTLAGLAQLARLGHAPALVSLEESLRDPALQRHVMGAVRVVLGAEQCIAPGDPHPAGRPGSVRAGSGGAHADRDGGQ